MAPMDGGSHPLLNDPHRLELITKSSSRRREERIAMPLWPGVLLHIKSQLKDIINVSNRGDARHPLNYGKSYLVRKS